MMASLTKTLLAGLACTAAAPGLIGTAAQADPISAINPVAYYKLDDPAGSVVAANTGSSGPAYDGAANAVAFGVPGPPGSASAASFNGTTSNIAVPNGTGALHVQSFTLEAFADPTVNPVLFTIYGQQRAAGGTGFALSLQNDHPALLLNNGAANVDLVATGATVALNRYSFLAATYDNGTGLADLYLNGALVAQQNVGTLNLAFSGNLGAFIGQEFPGQRQFAGSLADVALFNAPLTSDQIAAQYAAFTAAPEPASLALLGAGLVGLGLIGPRRRPVPEHDGASQP